MVADRGLGQAERLDEICDAEFALSAGAQERENLKSRRIGDGLQQAGECFRLITFHGCGQSLRAAGRTPGTCHFSIVAQVAT